MADYTKVNNVLAHARLYVLRYLKGYAAAVTAIGGLSAGTVAFINNTVAGSPVLTASFAVGTAVLAVANPILVIVARNISAEELANFEAALDAGDVGAVADQLVAVVNSLSEVHPDANVLNVSDDEAAALASLDGQSAVKVVSEDGSVRYVADQNGTDGEQR